MSATMATSSIGQEAATPFDFFDRSCLAPGPKFDAMAASAAEQQWPTLPDQVLQVLTPIANPTALIGWIASGDSDKIKVVVVSKGPAGATVLEGCTVGFYGVDSRDFETAMVIRAGPGSRGQQDTTDRINVVFKAKSQAGVAEFVTLALPETPERSD